MKKVLIILFFSLACKSLSAQAIDTTAYLRDSIQSKKSFYIGKPLSVLLHDLQLEVKSYSELLPLPSLPDPIPFQTTTLFFGSSGQILTRQIQKVRTPQIYIRFASPIQIPKAYLRKGGLLDASTDWTSAKANFFGQYVISSLEVGGL
jgi:hypothetical protein